MQIKSAKRIALVELLAVLAPDSSKKTLKTWIEKGRVSVDEKIAKRADQIVEEGQMVLVGEKRLSLKSGLIIVYEDRDLIVVDKPAGLLSVATVKEGFQTAHAILKRNYPKRNVIPIHRLDKDTSGLLVFSCHEKARADLKRQLERREIHREYRARVHGDPGKGTWRCFLLEDARLFIRLSTPSKGKEAITHYEMIKRGKRTTLIKCTLETGRKHQIRVQAAEAGCPIVGDSKYGQEGDLAKRLHLHAVELSFLHPISRKLMRFSSRAPFE
ncbi:MAG: Ribosomal large subunit pseudouridine synthase D [Chlamydiae bacterium]|nr:Ribosomal large subunit pseudouridine synthase D [Chlamydiota bacterium]